MVVNPSEVDPYKCEIYGRFLHNLPEWDANAIFWSLFILDLFLLILASSFYARQTDYHQSVDEFLHIAHSIKYILLLNF